MIDILRGKGIILKSMESIPVSLLGSRKRVNIYLGIDMKRYFTIIITISKKSRFITKDAQDLIKLHQKIQKLKDTTIKKKIALIDAPLCSKAEALLKDEGWRIFNKLR